MCSLGVSGVASLLRKFRKLDVTGDRLLSFNEFARGLLDEGLLDSVAECRELFRAVDSDATGNVDFHEFLAVSCGDMSSRREAIVLNVFRSLDPAGIGAVRFSELLGSFDARAHPFVRTGQLSADVVQQEFQAMFDTGVRNRLVALAEFQLYYMVVSTAIDDDKQFERVVQDTWQMPGALCT
jgi:Ca2+-binding EF-hand superfamily protein